MRGRIAPTPEGPTPAEGAGARFSMERRQTDGQRDRTGRIAIAHDWLVGYRGGEAVLDRLVRIVTERHEPAGLYVMFDSRRPVTPAIDAMARVTSRLNRVPLASRRLRRWLLPLYPSAVRSLGRRLADHHRAEPIDLLISTSSAAIKGLVPPGDVPHVCYCHSPARYLWDQQGEYTRGRGLSARLRAIGLGAFGESLREWDRRTVRNVTTFIANSRHTATMIETHFAREARVVHPPVRTEFFTPSGEERQQTWLVVSALEPYKRVDLAIEAATRAGRTLLVVGKGSEMKNLRKHAKRCGRQLARAGLGKGRAKLVKFLGRIDDEQLRSLYRRSSLLLFPQVEDFGIVAAEATAWA